MLVPGAIWAFCLSLLAVLVAGAPSPAADVGDATPTLKSRAVPSGSYTCYSACPAKTAVTPAGGYTVTVGPLSHAGTCAYTLSSGSPGPVFGKCYYDSTSGALTGVDGALASCPSSAGPPLCIPNSQSPAANQFKRAVEPRVLTPGEHIIRSRQYKPRRLADE